MTNINFPVIELENNKFQVFADLSIYTKEVIIAATYKFSHLYYIHIATDTENSNIARIIFEPKNENSETEKAAKQFCNELIDQQLRQNVNVQFGHIRDMIVEEAFKPINTKQ